MKKWLRPNMELHTLYGMECSYEDAKESGRFIFRKNVPVLDLTKRLGACFFFNKIKNNQLSILIWTYGVPMNIVIHFMCSLFLGKRRKVCIKRLFAIYFVWIWNMISYFEWRT
jgi:hypothetical protein